MFKVDRERGCSVGVSLCAILMWTVRENNFLASHSVGPTRIEEPASASKTKVQMKLCLHLRPSSLDPGPCEQDWRSRLKVFETFLDSCGLSLIGGPDVEQSSGGAWSWRYEVDLVSEGATYSLIGLLRVWMSGPAGRTVLIEHDTVSILISQMNQLDLLLPRLRPFDTLS